MASRFMKIKRIVIPFITLVIMTSQLAGCATLSSQEMLESAQESPDISIEWATPDPGQQSLDASGAITVGDQQFVTDATNPTDTEDDSDIGLINTDNQEKQPLSGDTLISYFQLAYEGSEPFIVGYTLEDAINFELQVLETRAENEDQLLPTDYADQYRSWRPVNEQPSSQQQASAQQEHDNTQGNTQQTQIQTPTTQQPSTPTTQKPSSGGKDIYNGFNTYEEYIADIQKQLPGVSIEQIKKDFPDQANCYVDEDLVQQDINDGRMHGAN